jgi:hypothetical protein
VSRGLVYGCVAGANVPSRRWPQESSEARADRRPGEAVGTTSELPAARNRGPGESNSGTPLTTRPMDRPTQLLRDAVWQAVAEQLCEEFVGCVDAVGVLERVEIQQEPAYHGERECC